MDLTGIQSIGWETFSDQIGQSEPTKGKHGNDLDILEDRVNTKCQENWFNILST